MFRSTLLASVSLGFAAPAANLVEDGRITEIGKIAVAENPLTSIHPLENPEWVMVRGRIVL
jgi:hypothetical protein